MNRQQWLDFLNEKTHTDEEWQQASKSANNWGCCAVGSSLFDDPLDPMLKKNQNCVATLNKLVMKIMSQKVHRLGMEFYHAIEYKNISEAKRLFNKIHRLKVKKAL